MSKNLSYFLQRIQGVCVNSFRLSPQNSDSATANGTVKFSLPSNTLWNVKSTQFLFSASTDTDSAATSGARLPPAECLIDRIEISAGGILIAQGHTMYNVLTQAKKALTKRHLDPVLGHPEYVREKSYVDGKGGIDATGANKEIETTGNEYYPSANGATQFAVSAWEGFLGSCSIGLLDCALLPDLVLTIFLAPDSVLSSVAGVSLAAVVNDGALNAKYRLSNMRLLVEAVSLGSSVYDELVSRRIAQTGYVEIFYKTYNSFVDTHSSSSKFQISTQSLDRVWVIHRAAGYDTQGGLVRVAGHKIAGGFLADATGGAVTREVGLHPFDQSMGTAGELYRGKFFNFARNSTAGATTHHLLINGSMCPNFAATSSEMYAMSRGAAEDKLSYPEHKHTLKQFEDHDFVLVWRFNLPGSEKESILSGIDARSLSLQCDYRTTGVDADTNVTIFTENSSSLRIGQNRQIEVIN